MSYLPLARKYRPQTFDDLIGQAHVTTTLSRALEGKRVAQAYLFTGQRGVGKTSAARILAKCLNCEQGPTAKPCNRCAGCTQITQGSSLDVIEIDGASNRGIDEIRSLRETVPFAPAAGSFRVYIIDEVHMLTLEAFNALLKTLEEPPAHVKFIFATTAASKVPSTILSRCQRFDFRRIEPAVIVGALKRIAKTEQMAVEEPALYAIARASDGSLRDAEVILDQAASFVKGTVTEADVTELLGGVESDALIAWAQALLDRDAPAALIALTQQLEQGKEAPQLLAGLLRHLRNLLILSSTKEASSREVLLTRLIDEPAERLARLDAQAAQASPEELLVMLQLLTGAYELVRRSPMGTTILELVILKLATRESWQPLAEIAKRLEQFSAGAAPSAGLEASRALQPAPAPSKRSSAVAPVRMTATPAEPSGAASPAASEPAAPAASAAVPEAWRSLWPAFLEQLGQQKISLAAYLAESRPLQLEGTTLTVGLPGFTLHQEVLSSADNRKLIERLLAELSGTPVMVEYTTATEPVEPVPDAPQTPQTASPEIIQDIVNLFNATVMDPPPRAT
ncbi:MAG: DNA polymerase III subunit gamma/tau [Candidatus Omnitrophica bacterium]|nr:DNA polymerase III subunit gamma/tau [Candidatus Omnitrophota bacterium]